MCALPHPAVEESDRGSGIVGITVDGVLCAHCATSVLAPRYAFGMLIWPVAYWYLRDKAYG